MSTTRGVSEAPERTSPPTTPAPPTYAERDVRRKRPPALSFLLRMDTLRRVARGLKAAARDVLDVSVTVDQAKDYVWFAFLVTALLFAKAGLYGDRAVRPG